VASVPGQCTTDAACGAGNYCNTALRTCKPVTAFCQACKSDAECGAGSSCAAYPLATGAGTLCVPKCGTGCANGLQCSQNLCFPPSGCGKSNTCVPDSLKLCNSDGDCGDAAQACDLTLRACVARVRSCTAGFACDPQSKLCVAACRSDGDCGYIEAVDGGTPVPGYQCRANACFRLALCSQDSECSSGQI